jgi:hypothetical protein
MIVEVKYSDGTYQKYANIPAAQQGIRETALGCNFATTVKTVRLLENGTYYNFAEKWSLKLVSLR